jgi:hypothetical protein
LLPVDGPDCHLVAIHVLLLFQTMEVMQWTLRRLSTLMRRPL